MVIAEIEKSNSKKSKNFRHIFYLLLLNIHKYSPKTELTVLALFKLNHKVLRMPKPSVPLQHGLFQKITGFTEN